MLNQKTDSCVVIFGSQASVNVRYICTSCTNARFISTTATLCCTHQVSLIVRVSNLLRIRQDETHKVQRAQDPSDRLIEDVQFVN